MEWLLIDSIVVCAHPCAAGAPQKKGGQAKQALGKSVGGFRTKIHASVDALGNSLRLLLTGGLRGDATQAIALLEGWVARLARYLYEVPRGKDERLVKREDNWQSDNEQKWHVM